MISVTVAFLVAALVVLVSTPAVSSMARALGILDRPSDRKVHREAVPRVGGVAIFLGVGISLCSVLVYGTALGKLIAWETPRISLWLGAALAFGLGLLDDVRRLSPRLKLIFQASAALVAYMGGVRIQGLLFPWGTQWELGIFSMPVTLFWFVLLMNAINLIDGLDGLAAGVSFFACSVLGALCLISDRMVEALGFAAVAGACLGFLRYNFNPASVFMGDGGSYFLGYIIAGMSVLGSLKSQTAVALLIPVVALGIPLMDALWATVRRFILGAEIFKPDRDHLHHRLLAMGMNQKKAVLLMYGASVCLGAVSLSLVYIRDFRAGVLLLLLSLAAILAVRKLGYLEYLAAEKILGWFEDLSDEMGIKKDRRTFLAKQVEIYQSHSLEQMWERVLGAAEHLGMDFVEMRVFDGKDPLTHRQVCLWEARQGQDPSDRFDPAKAMFISLPLGQGETKLGLMCLAKDLSGKPLPRHALRRIEHLRRTVGDTLLKLREKEMALRGERGQAPGVENG